MTAADCYLIDLLIYMIDDPIFSIKSNDARNTNSRWLLLMRG